jgi:ectoine hydroxylase-related dioxygenase (phytanoyl-CoA dioxygenase family)
VPPHQDISYNKHLSDFITVWIPLVKINNHSGCLRMFKKKYRKILKTKKVYNTIWNKIKNTGLGPYKDLNNLNLGDIVIFNKYKLHTSVPNNSNIIRFSLDLRFFFTRDQSSKSFYDISNNLRHVVQ